MKTIHPVSDNHGAEDIAEYNVCMDVCKLVMCTVHL
jgi:hypothetical protein